MSASAELPRAAVLGEDDALHEEASPSMRRWPWHTVILPDEIVPQYVVNRIRRRNHGQCRDVIDLKREIYRAQPTCTCILLVRQDRAEIVVRWLAFAGAARRR